MKKAKFIVFSVILTLCMLSGLTFSETANPAAQGTAVAWIDLDAPYGFYAGTSKTYLSENETATNEATYRFGEETMEIALTGKSEYAIIGRTFGYVDFNEISGFSWCSRGQGEYTVRLFSDDFELKKSYVTEDAGEQFYRIDFERENISGIQDLSMEICVSYEPAEETATEEGSSEDGEQEDDGLPDPIAFSQMYFQGTFDEFYKLFPVTISINDIVYGDKISEAKISVDGKEYYTDTKGTAVLALSKGMHYYSVDASGYLQKRGYFEVEQEYDSETVTTIELGIQAQYENNHHKISTWLIVAIVCFLALNIFFVLLYVFRKEGKNEQ